MLFVRERQIAVDAWLDALPDRWVVGATARGMNHASPSGSDHELMKDEARAYIAQTFNDWLPDAPRFVVGYFGQEAYDDFQDQTRTVEAVVAGSLRVPGAFVDESTWIASGKSEGFERINATRCKRTES